MLEILATEAPKSAGAGAPFWQVAVVAGSTTIVTVLALRLIVSYRAGGARPLRRAAALTERFTGVPGWASLPAVVSLVAVAVALFGAEWDISLHIDEGRDAGPLGTAAHYPILLGLLTFFAGGLLAVGMAPRWGRRSSRAAMRVRGLWPIPVGGALILAGASMSLLAFPLDDLWHRTFGQDVTLWGPTHIMLIACAIIGALGVVLLMVEGARSVGRDVRSARGLLGLVPMPVLMGVIFLAGITLEMDEFNYGVPQFQLVWHPVMTSLAATLAFVVARVWGGRGAALKVCVLTFLAFVPLTLIVHFGLGESFHDQPLYLAEALMVELLAIRGVWRRPVVFGAVAGVASGTIGFAAEYGWTQIAFRLPWTTNLIGQGVPLAILAGICGGVLGALLAQALTGRLRLGRGPLVVAVAAGVVLVAVGAKAAALHTPKGASATITVSHLKAEKTLGKGHVETTGDVSVRFHGTNITDDADWVRIMAWQGHGSFNNVLREQADGTWRTTHRAPLGGRWRTLLSVSGRGTVLGVPIYMPVDPPVGFAGFPLRRSVARSVASLETLAQVERKPDAPNWAFKPATLAVLGLNLLLVIGMGWVAVRLGGVASPGERAPDGERDGGAAGPDGDGVRHPAGVGPIGPAVGDPEPVATR